MKHIRLFIVDDHVLFRRGLTGLLSDMSEFEVVGDAASGEDALRSIPKAKPDVILLDVNMPGMGGVQALHALRDQGVQTPVLMLTISQDEKDLVGAIMAGASGYLLKNAEPDTLRRTLLDVVAGKSILSPEMTEQVFRIMRRSQAVQSQDQVSEREMEVLKCLARGLSTSSIASSLYISENTVKTHIRHLMDKMRASNRREIVSKALKKGLL